MAETDRPHRSSSINSSSTTANTTTMTSDLFVCFTSRFSSSSMKLSSKSFLSPGRRLRSSGSIRNGGGILASPMFGGNGSRKRSGSGFENNPEPSSPKVTCIGQVRVKTRKHVKKKMRAARSMRRKGGGETSFRRPAADQSDGFDRLVHLPVAICESLRSFGSELNCFFPCRSSCMGDESKPSEKGGCDGRSSCGAVFTRWFVAVDETQGGKKREIELVVGGRDEEEDDDRRSHRRRHVFDGIDFGEIEMKAAKKKEKDEEEEARFVPPKNALLLMRCGSDPMKMAALANRVREFSESQNDGGKEDVNEDYYEEVEEKRRFELEMEDKKRIELCEKWISGESIVERQSTEAETTLVLQSKKVEDQKNEVEEEEEIGESVEEGEAEVHEHPCDKEIEDKFIRKIEDDLRNVLEEEDAVETRDSLAAATAAESGRREEEEESVTITLNQERSESTNPDSPEPDTCPKNETNQVLPECLLLMMCEPKLSMEVSKETWVCKTDFVRWLPERPPLLANKTDGDSSRYQPKKRTGTAADSNCSSRRRSTEKRPSVTVINPVLLQPPRSSCSYPAAPPLLVAAEQKAGKGNKEYEPLVLTRCNSEPRRSSTAKPAAPEACLRKNRKLVEPPHRPATLGVGF